MKRLFLSLAALAMLAAPAAALTLDQAQAELAGMHCSGSACTASQTISATIQNPDIVTSREVLVAPATRSDARDASFDSFGHCPPMQTMNGGWATRTNVNADCTALSINPGSGGTPAIYRTEVNVTPGGTSIVQSCETTTKTLTYNGPNTDRAGAWSVDTSTSSSDGAC